MFDDVFGGMSEFIGKAAAPMVYIIIIAMFLYTAYKLGLFGLLNRGGGRRKQ